MISFEEALKRVLDSVTNSAPGAVPNEQVPLEDALGRYVAESISAPINVPGFDNSAMDGYAVRVSDIEMGKAMPVSQRIAAGKDSSALESGTVARIFTGAKMPLGADAVILQEDSLKVEHGKAAGSNSESVRADAREYSEYVEFAELPVVNQHIRPAGQDIQRGSLLVEPGKRLTAADIALIASVGIAEVQCARPLKVAFFSTGDELRQPGEALEGAQIYNSNRFLLAGCLRELGMQPIDLGCIEDSAEDTRNVLLQASEQADCILTTGGMSVGEEDYVRSEAQALGELNFWKIAMKPGKPFAMGEIKGVPFFGLPGNPVSTYVTFQVLVKPWLLKKMGAVYLPVKQRLIANFDFENRGRRLDFVRAKLQCSDGGEMKVALYDNQSSGVLSSIVWADGFVPVPATSEVRAGDRVEYWGLS